jgi:hypothetical protein
LTGYGTRLAGAKELSQEFSPQPFESKTPSAFDAYLTPELIEKYQSFFDPVYVWGVATLSSHAGGVITSLKDFVTILQQTNPLIDPVPKMIAHFLKEITPKIFEHEPEKDQPRKDFVLAAIAVTLLATGEDIDMNTFGPSLHHIASEEEISIANGGLTYFPLDSEKLFIRSFLSQYRSRQTGPVEIEFEKPLPLTANPDDLTLSREEYIASGKWFEDIRKSTTPELSSITFSNPWGRDVADPAHQKQNCTVTSREFLSHVHPDFMYKANNEHQKRFLKILYLRPHASSLRPENDITFISDSFESLEFIQFMMAMPDCPERNSYLAELIREHPENLVRYASEMLSCKNRDGADLETCSLNMSQFFVAFPTVSLVDAGFIFDPIWHELLQEFSANDEANFLFRCYNQAYALSTGTLLSLDDCWNQYVAWGATKTVSASELRHQSWDKIKAKKSREIEAGWEVEDFFIEFNKLLWGQTNPQAADFQIQFIALSHIQFFNDFGEITYAIQNNDRSRFDQALAQINAEFLAPLGYGLVAHFEPSRQGLVGVLMPVKIVAQEERAAGPLKDIPVTYVRNTGDEFRGLRGWYVANGMAADLEAAKNFGVGTSFVQPEITFSLDDLDDNDSSSKSLCGVVIVLDQEEQNAHKIWQVKSSQAKHPHPYVQAMYNLLSRLQSQNEDELAAALIESSVSHEIGHVVEHGYGVTQKDEVYACLQQVAGSPDPRAILYHFAKLVFAYDSQKQEVVPMALWDQQGQTTGYVLQQNHGQGQMYFFLAFARAQGELGADETWLSVYESNPQRFDEALSNTLGKLSLLSDDQIRDFATTYATQWLGE